MNFWLLFLIFGTAYAGICKNDDYTPLGNGKCYRAFTTLTSATSASSACHLTGGELTSIHSETDNYIVGLWLGGNMINDAWIGLQCDTLDNCYWLDGTKLNYTHFDDNPPNLNKGHCFFMKAGTVSVGTFNTWATGDCDKTKKNFICEEVDQIPTKRPTTINPPTTQFPFSHSPSCGSYYEFNGWCYNIGTSGLSESDAELSCLADGGHLVSIHDAYTNNFVYTLIKYSQVSFAWIGLKYLPNSVYIWTDTTKMDYNNIPGVLAAQPGSCFSMSNVDQYYPAQWVPNACTTTMAYVCQRPKIGLPTTTMPTTLPTNPCGQTLFGGLSGTIYSPNYPYNFRSANCYYTINADSNTVNIEIPAIQASAYWVLSVYEGVSPERYWLIDSISADDLPRILKRSSGMSTMLIAFWSDSVNIGQPFAMNYNSTLTPIYPLGNNSHYSTQAPIRTTQPASLSCDLHWYLDDVRRICYAISSPGSFADSMTSCRRQNAQLISVHNQQEENDLYNILGRAYPSGYFDVWIGGIYSSADRYWNWVDGTAFGYVDWMPGSGNGTVGSCITAAKHGSSSNQKGWVTKDCGTYYPSVCYKTPNIG
ncbi:unnamed protein product, partial [Mesorhabditis belari]|uniref:Uncharacterized protein n=1 Tax=Mesorhabditis belari TaxID=2138241 RepID=A0AAF3EQ03_9BILA